MSNFIFGDHVRVNNRLTGKIASDPIRIVKASGQSNFCQAVELDEGIWDEKQQVFTTILLSNVENIEKIDNKDDPPLKPFVKFQFGDRVQSGWVKGIIASDPIRIVHGNNSHWCQAVKLDVPLNPEKHHISTLLVNCDFLEKA